MQLHLHSILDTLSKPLFDDGKKNWHKGSTVDELINMRQGNLHFLSSHHPSSEPADHIHKSLSGVFGWIYQETWNLY